ncbi:histone-lysine N-methyltransferase 2B-like [Amphibalanus amphitrite]|uniref:histone-lysine N-methyltransferase 2B-like n=1 Tax=Amphibalanus amphitrite TaxID=1232801 RepID=UPI001C90658A|nr:histone-lysine N-methyltransferase 2B-like [Amphibalanus amphitrite]
MQDGGENIEMARARFPGKSSQQNGSRKRLWLPEDQFEECSYVTRNEASVAIRSTKNFDVLFSGSSKNPESLRRLSSCLGESVYAVSKRLRAFSAPPCEPQGNDSGGRSSSSSGGGASARSSPAAGSGRAARRNGRTPSAEPAAAAPALESFSGGRGRTRADSARVGAQSPAAEEAGRRGRSRSQSQSGSPAHRAAGAAAAEPGPVRTRRAAAAAETPPPVGGPPETAGRSTRSTSQPTSAAGPAPTAAAGPGPGLVVTRSSRVVRPARRFLDESSSSSSASPAPPPPPPVGEASSRPSRPARALSPSSDVELDEGVIKTVVEYADSMAAAPGRAAAAPAAVEPAPVSQPAQADIEAMLRSQWDGRLKVRGREEEAAAVPGRHLLRQPRLHLNNRVLKRLRDGRDLTYLSEQDEAPQLEPEPAGAPGAGNGAPSAGSGPGGHVTCGTCGSRRFVAVPDLCYKFGSWICMHCIKFVLTTLKQTSLAPKCIDNKELCRTHADPSEPELAPPEQRCEACWLQACLNALNFSEERHNRLRSSLPRSHQAAVPLFSRKRRQETGGCQFGPSPPPPAAVPALPAPPPTRCPNKAWGGGDARDSVGFETLSRPAAGDSKEPAQEPAGSQPPAADGNTGSEANSAPDKPANNRTEDTDGDGSNDKMHNASEKGILKENSTSVAPPGTEALSNEESKSAEPTVTEGGAKDEPTAAAPTRVETRSKDDLKPATPARTETGSKDEPKPEVLTRPETRSKEEWRAAAPARPGTRSRTDRWPPPPPGVHSRKAVTVVPLGGGWKRREFVRKGGRLDLIVYSPDGTRFKSVVELQAYLRGMDITRKAQSFFTDGVPPPAEPGQQEPVIRDSFVKRGPRVKVVCRSASLVLGQPRATFGGGSPPAPTLSPQPPALSPRSPSPGGKENRAAGRLDGWPPGRRQAVGVRKLKKRRHVAGDDKSSSRNVLMKLKVLHKYKHLQQSRGNKERIRKSRCGVCLGCKAKNCTKCVFCSDMIKYGGPGKLKKSCIARVCKRPLLPGVNSLKLLPPPAGAGDRSERSPELAPPTGSPARPADRGASAAAPTVQPGRRSSPLVRLDHWSPLEPTELWERGLAVLAAQPPGVPVLCFVCASAGQEEMLYCNSCCEPYHPFCLEEVEVPLSALHQENWVCARCQVCCVCGAAPPGQPLHRCHQCSETYHLACLGPHGCAPPGRSDQPWTCVRCTRCRSCQKAEIHQYVGNLPLCGNCFQLHQRGNYCPLCGGCYEDDDYDTKMMECESCHTWVHAHCESLSEEMYQILSFLPESVSYLCDRCLPRPPAADGAEPAGSPERRRLPREVSWRRAVRHEFESGCAAVVRAVWACLSRRPAAPDRADDGDGPVPADGPPAEDDQVVPDAAAASAEPPTAARLRQLRTQLRRGDVVSVRAFHRLLQAVLAEAEQAGAGGVIRARAAYQRAMADAFPWFQYDGRVVTPIKAGVAHPDHPYAAGAGAPAAALMTSPTEVRARASPSKYTRTPLKRLSAASTGNHDQFRPLIDLCNRHYQSLRALEAGRLADSRRCGLCGRDGEAGPAGRLLWAGAGLWLHVGCLLHSTEVFEEVDGSLRAVRAALHRGRQTRCHVCAGRGATVACGLRSCARPAHLPCAAESGWHFGALPSCPEHRPEGAPAGSGPPDPVRRRVFIEEGDWLRRRPTEAPLDSAAAVLGSLTVHSFGDRVVPSGRSLMPVGMTCSRVYWSTINPRRRTVYTVRTVSAGPLPPSDRHCLVDHSLSHAQVERSLQQLEEWRRAVSARAGRPSAAARFTFEPAAEPRASAAPAEPPAGCGASEDHEQQVRSCLESLLGNVCRSVVEEEETLLAEANLNIPILENVDNDFLNLMLKELCEGDGATYLGGEGGGGTAGTAAGLPAQPPQQQQQEQQEQQHHHQQQQEQHHHQHQHHHHQHHHQHQHQQPSDHGDGELGGRHLAGVSEAMGVPCDSAGAAGLVTDCGPRRAALSIDCQRAADAMEADCQRQLHAGLTESQQVAEIAESLEQLSHGSSEVTSSQLQMSPQQPDEPPPPPPHSAAFDWQTGRARHRSERLPGYPASADGPLLAEYPAAFEAAGLGSQHASAFRPAARRGRSLSAEQASYEELMAFKPVATVMPEPRDQLWPAELRTYSAQVHCRRRSGSGAPAGPLLHQPPFSYQPWWPPMSGWAPHDAWPGQKADGWQQSAAAHPRSEPSVPLPRQLSQLDGADDSDDESVPSKCPKCRRMYRTRESMLKHQDLCDFEVDSSGSSEAEEDGAEAARPEPRRPAVEPGEAPRAPPPAATGEAEVSSTTAPLPSETPRLQIKQEVEEAPAAPARASPARPRRRSPKKKAPPVFGAAAGPAVAAPLPPPPPPPPPASMGMPLPQLLMIGNQLVSPGQMLLPQVQQQGVVIVQGNVSYTVVPQQEPLLYGQPAPFVLNYPQLALPPGANLQHLGSFELGPAGGQLAQPVVYSMAGLGGGLVASLPAVSVAGAGVQPHLPAPLAGGAMELRPPAPPPAAAPEPMEVSLPPPPPVVSAPPPPPPGRSSPVQSSQVDSSRPQSADSPPAASPAPCESATSPPAAAAAPGRHVQLVKPSTVVAPAASSDARKVAKVKPRPTYSYRDAMKTNPMLRQEKGKLMRRLVPLEVDSSSASGRAAAPAAGASPPPPPSAPSAAGGGGGGGAVSPAPSVSSSGTAPEAGDGPKLSYRIKLRRDRADDGFQVREIVRNPSGDSVSPGATVKSVKITARVGSLGSDLLVVPRRQTADAEVEVRGDRSADRPGEEEADKENRGERGAAETDPADPAVVYEVTSADGFKFRSPDIAEVWRRVFEAVQDARTGMKMKPLAYNARSVSGRQMLGLTHDAVQFLLEQMPGAEDCSKHSFRFHRPEFGPLKENPFGCARAEGFTHRKPIDMFSWLASKHRQLPEPSSPTQTPPANKLSRRGSSLELPMAMRYRQLCDSTRDTVGVYRSPISGRGLFCKRTVEAGQMVIEYAGQVIRSSLTDIRERYYSSRGIGCYMFRIDDDFVVDATMKGNAARFINHSCNPNCYSRVVDILGKKHIIIFALRKILRGEELTYDYKFPIEEDKIPCTCGARRCRKYLN